MRLGGAREASSAYPVSNWRRTSSKTSSSSRIRSLFATQALHVGLGAGRPRTRPPKWYFALLPTLPPDMRCLDIPLYMEGRSEGLRVRWRACSYSRRSLMSSRQVLGRGVAGIDMIIYLNTFVKWNQQRRLRVHCSHRGLYLFSSLRFRLISSQKL